MTLNDLKEKNVAKEISWGFKDANVWKTKFCGNFPLLFVFAIFSQQFSITETINSITV